MLAWPAPAMIAIGLDPAAASWVSYEWRASWNGST
jgi:hypothetical protein